MRIKCNWSCLCFQMFYLDIGILLMFRFPGGRVKLGIKKLVRIYFLLIQGNRKFVYIYYFKFTFPLANSKASHWSFQRLWQCQSNLIGVGLYTFLLSLTIGTGFVNYETLSFPLLQIRLQAKTLITKYGVFKNATEKIFYFWCSNWRILLGILKK